MNEQRRQILEMLAEGKLTADEAERLIGALERERPEAPGATSRPKARPKYLRVVMDAEDGTGGDGASRMNIRIPLQLLRAGVRLTALLPPAAVTRVNAELDKAGVPIDLAELKPQHLEDLIEHLDDMVVDLDEPGSKMRVYCE
ncbi:SHOCT-like domain-containing protein [Streptomyces sp. NPDC051041]|uniref:SHOCT-like domain-containing protein n=1 Tax=Streptomyces sp. NPDC051041 TaxID=3365640 RepID=UPI0037AB9ABF